MTQLGINVIVDCIILDIGNVSYYFKYCLYILFIGIVCIRVGIKSERSLNKNKSIKKSIGNAAIWSSLAEIVAKMILPITNMILAMLLTPEIFGIVALRTCL